MESSTARVVIAYDGSAGAATAVRAAAGLFGTAQAYVATVPRRIDVTVGTAMPVLPGVSPTVLQETFEELEGEARSEARGTAQRAVDEARALGVQAEIADVGAETPAWSALLDAAHGLDADVLVSGTRGRGAFARAVLGSTSAGLLHNTDIPLLIVPDGGGTLEGPVIAAYDGSPGATHAIEVAGSLLGGHPAVVVHVWEPLFQRTLTARALEAGPVDDLGAIVVDLHRALVEQAAATTEDGVAAARAAGLDAVGETIESDEGAWRAVAAAARSHGASVIAVGSRGLGSARSALLGSVSSGLIHNAELPVLVVPDASP